MGAPFAAGPGRLLIGRVAKAHGLGGEVVVEAITSETDTRLAPGAEVLSDRGPLRVTAVRPHQHRWLVTFEGVAGREAADALAGLELYAEPLEVPGALWVHELVGALVVTPDGTAAGRVRAVLANPAADLLELDTGVLVPETFVVGWEESGDAGGRRLLIDPPPGLLDL